MAEKIREQGFDDTIRCVCYHDNSGSGRHIRRYPRGFEVWTGPHAAAKTFEAGPFPTLEGAKVAYILLEAND